VQKCYKEINQNRQIYVARMFESKAWHCANFHETQNQYILKGKGGGVSSYSNESYLKGDEE